MIALRRSLSKGRAFGALLVALGLVTSACGGGQPQAPTGTQAAASPAAGAAAATKPPRVKVRFAVAVPVPDPGQVWAFVPNGAKYFEQENLDVEMLTADGGAAAVKLVATGGADVGIGAPDIMFNSVLEGVDVKGIASVVTHQIFRIIVKPDGPITTYAQLKGKKIGVSSLSSGSFPFAKFAFLENGIDPAKDLEFVTIGTGGPALEALKTGKVDAVSTWDTQIEIFKELGTNPRLLPESSNVGFPADFIITSGNYLKSNPDVLVRFTRAVMKGIVYAQANPGRATDFFIQQFPDAAKARAREGNLNALRSRLANMTLIPAQQGKWGYIPLDLYAKVQDIGVSMGTMKTKQDLTKFLTNDLSDQIRNFKVEDVEKDAKAP